MLYLRLHVGPLPFKFAIIDPYFSYFLPFGGNFPTLTVKSRKNRPYYLFL